MPNPKTNLPKPVSITRPGEPLQLHTRTVAHAPGLHQALMDNPDHITNAGEPAAVAYNNINNLIREIGVPNPDSHHLTMIVDSEPVGSVSYLTSPDFDYAHVGWWVGHRHIGNRYAARAILLLADYVFENTKTPSLHARIRPENTPSIRTAQNVGFSHLGKIDTFDHYWLSRLTWEEQGRAT